MRLLELFQSTYDYELTYSKKSRGYDAEFHTKDDHHVNMVFAPTTYDKTEIFEIEFGRFTEFDDYSNTHGINNRGDALKIFATVLKIVKEVVVKEKPEFIFFTAEEASRKKFYASLVKRMVKDSNYKIVKSGDVFDEVKKNFSISDVYLMQRV